MPPTPPSRLIREQMTAICEPKKNHYANNQTHPQKKTLLFISQTQIYKSKQYYYIRVNLIKPNIWLADIRQWWCVLFSVAANRITGYYYNIGFRQINALFSRAALSFINICRHTMDYDDLIKFVLVILFFVSARDADFLIAERRRRRPCIPPFLAVYLALRAKQHHHHHTHTPEEFLLLLR